MAEIKIKLTEKTKNRLTKLCNKLGVKTKDIAPDFKKIYQESWCQEIKSKDGDEEAQLSALDVLEARNLSKYGMTTQTFDVFLKRVTKVLVSAKKEEYIKAYGFSKRGDDLKIISITAKGKNVDLLPTWINRPLKTSFAVLNNRGGALDLFKSPDNADDYAEGNFSIEGEEEEMKLVEKLLTKISIIRAPDHKKQVVIMGADPVVRAMQWNKKDGGTITISDDSVTREHIIENGNFTCFTDSRAMITFGGGSKVNLIGDVDVPRNAPEGTFPRMGSVWLIYPAGRIIPLLERDKPDKEPEEKIEEVSADDLDVL